MKEREKTDIEREKQGEGERENREEGRRKIYVRKMRL